MPNNSNDYQTTTKTEWRVSVATLRMQGVNLPDFPASMISEIGLYVSVASGLYELVHGILAHEIPPECLQWYVRGVQDSSEQEKMK